MTAVSLAFEVLFALLFVATLVSYIRRRDVLSRDVMLIFVTVAALFGVIGLSAVVGRLPDAVLGAAIVLLLAQPVLTLRMAHRLRPVPRIVWAAAIVGFVATASPFLIVPLDRAGVLTIPAVAVFVAIDLAAAFFLGREARLRVGSARVRLGAAAAASAAMGLALAFIGFGSGFPLATETGRVVALAAAMLYVVAFMPPAWVRKVWSSVATFEFTDELLDAPAGEAVGDVWQRAAELARRTTGALAAVVVAGEPPKTLAVAADAAVRRTLSGLGLTRLPTVDWTRSKVADRDDELGALGNAIGATEISILPFGHGGSEKGALLLFRAHPSLFATDDHSIVASLIGRALVFAERSQAREEQAALADRLALTVQALEQASQAKSDFLASMSHELRTPLSAIIGFSSLMRDEPLEGGRRSVPDEWVEHVHRSGEHLLALINDVLDLTKIEAGRIELQLEPFDLSSALAESVEGLRPLADRKGLEMTVDADAGSIRADRGRLRQIVYNLLSNAIKFTPKGGRIGIEARWIGDEARIAVFDSGVGIAPEDLEHIFQEFSQVGDMKAREAGTGLGLALSRRLAEAHGGQISVTSRPGSGSRFEVCLPDARVVAAAAPEPATIQRPTDNGATVLIIEDDPGAVRLLRTYLETEGYGVAVATDGSSGLAAARSQQPAAIILDVLLPGIDGWEVLRRLKADHELRDVPVVVVTVVDERNVAMSLGAVDYFLKPVQRQALLARLGQYTFTTKVKQRSVRVLAIDDEPAARELIVNALQPEGFDVVVASSGREGVAMALAQPPELVICDLVMPDMDGYEVVDQLHANEATRDATILIVTSHELSAADRERLNGKVADILRKGEDSHAALVSWLRRAASASRRRQELEAQAAS